MKTVTVTAAECHNDCLDVAGPDGHAANVNPVGGTTNWRVGCDFCMSCVSVLSTKAEALEVAKKHVFLTRSEFWDQRANGLA